MPTQAGYSSASRNQIQLSVKGDQFYFDHPTEDYCSMLLSCENPMAKGDQLSGYLLYSRFKLPTPYYLEPKKASVDAGTFWCDERPWLK